MLDLGSIKFDVELNSPTDEDIANFIKGIDKEKPVQVLLTGDVNISAKSIASLLSAILDGSISRIETNDYWFRRRTISSQNRASVTERQEASRIWQDLNHAGYKNTLPFGEMLQQESEKLVPEGRGNINVYWTNALSLNDMFFKAGQVRNQIESPPNKTGSFSFLMPEDKIPAAIMLSSILTQELVDDVSARFKSTPQKPVVLDSAVAGHKNIAPVPVSYEDGYYRITVDVDFERKTLGEIFGVDATKYKRVSSNDGHHYISIPESDLNQALGLSEGAARQRS